MWFGAPHSYPKGAAPSWEGRIRFGYVISQNAQESISYVQILAVCFAAFNATVCRCCDVLAH